MADAVADELSKMVQMFEESEETTRPARQLSERDRDYTDLKQWTDEEETTLKARNQPVVTFDRTKRKVNSLLGLEKQTRKDPKAFPRNPQDEASAHAATDAIRYVCDDCRWDDKRSSAAENLIIEGTGIVKVGVKQVRGDLDPDIIRIPWDRFFHDPHSAEFDFNDASYLGEVIWMEMADAKRKFKDREDALESTLANSTVSDTYDDRPKHNLWADKKRKRVRVVEMYYKEGGGWKFCIFTKGGFLVDPAESPYQDEEKQPTCPLLAVSLYIDRDNNRYGEVRGMIGPQDEINKRRSKALHLINERQVRVSPNVSQDKRAIQKTLSDPRGVFVGEKDEVEILPTNDMAMANLQMLQEAKAEMDLMGLNAASIGKSQQDLSGKAIIAQQQGGMLEAATVLDRVRCLSLAVYRAVWNRIQQHWTAERWIRITDDERNTRFVGLNKPVTALEAQAKKLGVTRENFQQFAQQAPEQAQQLKAFAQTPQAQQVVDVENNVTELDVDISIDEGMDTPTIAAEQFEQLTKIMPGIVNLPPAMTKMLIQASSLRDKDKMLEELDKMAQQPQIPPEVQQQIEEGMKRLQELEAENQRLKADTAVKQAEIEVKHGELQLKGQEIQIKGKELEIKGAELGIKQFEAETDRIQAIKPEPAPPEKPEKSDNSDATNAQTAALMALIEDMRRPRTRVPIRDGSGQITAIEER